MAREKCMLVNPTQRTKVIEQLNIDADFFASCGIIDYSLIAFKVDRSEDLRHEFDGYSLDELECCRKGSCLKKLKCEKDNGNRRIFWHIGIIDYFQLWNLTKKIEVIYK